jgi:endonuclease YncB( thermonuclease family)
MGTFAPFCYRAWCKKFDTKTGNLVAEGAVHDGDSAWFILDNGFYSYLGTNCRLFGVNAYELNDPDPVKRQKAIEGRTWLKSQIEGKQVFIFSKGLEKYGRPLFLVWLSEADFGDAKKSVNAALIQTGLAVPFMGELI